MNNELLRLEQELIKGCGMAQERFHRVSSAKWKGIYQKITEEYADKTKTWKNGLHWANTNGYSPKSMKKLVGCYQVDDAAWFCLLPQIVPEDKMVYFLIDIGNCDWHFGEKFWIFESYIPELVKALRLLSDTAFLECGWSDYYIVDKKYKWLIGWNHHHVISCVGEGIDLTCLKKTQGERPD